MKYLETKHERNSAKITFLIMLILLLLLFVVGPKLEKEPEEYGVAVNFGTTDFGSGNVQPTKPIKSEPNNINRPTEEVAEPEQAEPASETAASQAEDIVTQDSEEAIVLKKQKEAEAKAKAEADAKAKAEAAAKAKAERIEREKREAEERKRKEEADKKRKLDALIGGIGKSDGTESGGEGNDNTAGDKGQIDGNPYAPSYFGGPGSGSGGVGYGLNGRGRPSFKSYKQDCNESGLVVVKIEVDRSGKVIKATPGVKGTQNSAACLLEPAKRIAMSHKWRADSKAPARQIGFVSINFKLGG